MKLTVFHDGQFWVGVAEETVDGELRAARHVFGREPHDEDVLVLVNRHLMDLFAQIGAGVPVDRVPAVKGNPKRRAREAARSVRTAGVSTYAQEAVKAEIEEKKRSRKLQSKEQEELAIAYKREVKRKKAKDKHRGR